MSHRRRLRRHLSFANVVACMALFVALGGGAYAATQVNGKNIVKQSIGGGKLKNETITSRQIKKNSLNSSVIDLSTLATVPTAQSAVSAQTAQTAGTATTATTANSAKTADSATTAQSATKATSAETAGSAETAASATNATDAAHADSADQASTAGHADTADSASTAGHADTADSADTAGHADTAGEADTVGGKTAANLTDTCPLNTTLFGGMCWDNQPRVNRTWIAATSECAAEQGRLPTISELVAYLLKPGEQVDSPNWSSEVVDLVGGDEQVLTSDETGRSIKPGGVFAAKFRCLFYRTNAG